MKTQTYFVEVWLSDGRGWAFHMGGLSRAEALALIAEAEMHAESMRMGVEVRS